MRQHAAEYRSHRHSPLGSTLRIDTLDCLLQVQNVSKVYRLYRRPIDRLTEILPLVPHHPPAEFWALRDISLRVERGEVLGVMGPLNRIRVG